MTAAFLHLCVRKVLQLLFVLMCAVLRKEHFLLVCLLLKVYLFINAHPYRAQDVQREIKGFNHTSHWKWKKESQQWRKTIKMCLDLWKTDFHFHKGSFQLFFEKNRMKGTLFFFKSNLKIQYKLTQLSLNAFRKKKVKIRNCRLLWVCAVEASNAFGGATGGGRSWNSNTHNP